MMWARRIPPETREKVEDAVLLVLVAILLLLVLAQKREVRRDANWRSTTTDPQNREEMGQKSRPVKGSSDREDRAR
jgi:hypothetical protein